MKLSSNQNPWETILTVVIALTLVTIILRLLGPSLVASLVALFP